MFLKDHDKTALIYNNKPISYRDLIANCAGYASQYRVKKGARVVLYSENRPEWIYAFYSVWSHGGITVPIDFSASMDDIIYVLKDCRPSVIFCSRDGKALITRACRAVGIKPEILNYENIRTTGTDYTLSIKIRDMNDTAVIMYTSGTTGKPKGVMLTYDNLLSCIEGITSLGMLKKGDCIIGLLPFHHIFPFQGTVLAPLYVGSTVAMVKNLTSEEILRTLRDHKVTMFLGVPKLYELFHTGIMNKINASAAARIMLAIAKKVNRTGFSRVLFSKVHSAFGGHVHSYLTGGARFEERISHDLRGLGFRLVEGYGLTETAPLVAFNPFSKIKPGTVGPPMAGTEAAVMDGEIVVRGRNVMKGYYRKPRETARALAGGWFHTGDTGFFDKDGYLHLTGRKDEMIVLPSGKNINPEEIEKNILRISAVIRDVGIIQKEGRLAALVVPDFDYTKKKSVVNILEHIKWKVLDRYNSTQPPYKRITSFTIIRGELPRTRLGKLRRFLLPGLMETALSDGSEEKEPDFQEYLIIKDYLEKLLGIGVRPDDHIELDLGMDSLGMVELQAFLETTFGVALNESAFSSFTTPRSLSKHMRRNRTALHRQEINWKDILNESDSFTVRHSSRSFHLIRQLIRPLVVWYFRLRFHGLEHLPDSPCIITPNHQSLLDVVLLLAILPDHVLHRTFFTARESLAQSRIIRMLSGKTNVIFINIENDLRGALRKAAAVLRHGMNLVIFPEGHRSRDGSIGPFKKTFAILSKELNIPVIPLAIRGSYEAFSRLPSLSRPAEIELTFCNPVYPGDHDYQMVAERVKSVISGIVEK